MEHLDIDEGRTRAFIREFGVHVEYGQPWTVYTRCPRVNAQSVFNSAVAAGERLGLDGLHVDLVPEDVVVDVRQFEGTRIVRIGTTPPEWPDPRKGSRAECAGPAYALSVDRQQRLRKP